MEAIEILEALKKLNLNDLDIDLEIMKYFGFCDVADYREGSKYLPNNSSFSFSIVNYTLSIDKALTLIPKEYKLESIVKDCHSDTFCTTLYNKDNNITVRGYHKFISISILIAVFDIICHPERMDDNFYCLNCGGTGLMRNPDNWDKENPKIPCMCTWNCNRRN